MSLGRYLERSDQTSRVLDTLTLLQEEPTRLDLIGALRSCGSLIRLPSPILRCSYLAKCGGLSVVFS